ncbi:MAG: flippase [Oscillospiraceae bacterium]|nr:flippase [Oscillospiraceae bacterium]
MQVQSIKKNYIYNTTFQIVSLLISVITVPYVSRVLGAVGIGKYSFANSIVSYFVLMAAFGSSAYGTRQISYYRDTKEKMSEAFWNLFFFRLIATAMMLVLYFLYLVCYGGVTLLNVILAANIANVAIDISWLFQGTEQFRQIAMRNLSVKICCAVLVFLLIKAPDDLWLYVLLIVLSNIAGNLVMWLSVNRLIDMPRIVHPFFDVKGIFAVFLPTIAIQVYMVLDKSMIGFITKSDYENGCYEQAELIARVSLTLVTSLGMVVLPRIGNLYNNNEIEKAKEYIYKSYRFVWVIAIPMTAGLLGIASMLVPVFLGEGYEGAIILLEIFSVLIVVVSLAYITGLSYLIPTEQQNVYTVAVTVAAVVNFLMNLVLIKKYNAVGAAVASVTAETIGLTVQLLYCIMTGQLESRKIFCSVWKYITASGIMLIVVFLMKSRLTTRAGSLIIIIGAAVIVYTVTIVALKDAFAIEIINNLKKKICIESQRDA